MTDTIIYVACAFVAGIGIGVSAMSARAARALDSALAYRKSVDEHLQVSDAHCARYARTIITAMEHVAEQERAGNKCTCGVAQVVVTSMEGQ